MEKTDAGPSDVNCVTEAARIHVPMDTHDLGRGKLDTDILVRLKLQKRS